jgi:hypothetical protein
VLRLGRNAAEFNAAEVSTQDLVAAITGASDNVVSARAQRRGAPTEPGGHAAKTGGPDGSDAGEETR